MADLFDSITFREVTLRNRIGVSPMCQYWSTPDGKATDWHLVHLGSRAVGGAALIIAEATAVELRGRISPRDAGLWNDAQIDPLARTTRFMKEYGAVAGVQLAHAGRKASTAPPYLKAKTHLVPQEQGGWPAYGPSPVPFYEGDPNPIELTLEDIRTIQQSFVHATRRALAAGYEWVELHAAHGYLCHSFQSPLSNHRTDQYGGSFANRTRLTLETTRAMRAAWPDRLPMSVRLSVTDWHEGGWTTEESIELARQLRAEGVDLIACSSGAGTPKAKIPIAPGFQVPLSDAVKRGANVPTAAVGVITEPEQADAIIREGKADLVLLGREMLRDPYWPFHAAKKLGQRDRLKLPAPYDYAVG